MARVVKSERKHHAITIRERRRDRSSEAFLVGRGHAAYLWAGPATFPRGGGEIHTFSGATALRALAYAILRNVPAPKPRKPSRQPRRKGAR